MLFLDFSSVFYIIISQHLVDKMGPLSFSIPLCNWLLAFLIVRPQALRIGQSITLITVSPLHCALSPSAAYPGDTKLHPQGCYQPHGEVCGRHNSAGPHQGRQRLGLQSGGGTAGGLV